MPHPIHVFVQINACRTSVFIRDEIFCGAEAGFASIWDDGLPPYCIIRMLKNNSMVVKPDYFTALLWKRLVGRRLLGTMAATVV